MSSRAYALIQMVNRLIAQGGTMIHVRRTNSITGVGTYIDELTKRIPSTHEVVDKREWNFIGLKIGGNINRITCQLNVPEYEGDGIVHAGCNWAFNHECDSVMVHDLNPLMLPDFKIGRKMFKYQRKMLRERILFTPSYATKEGLMRWLKVDPDQIIVAPHGVDFDTFYPRCEGSTKGFIIYAGGYRPYKRIEEGIRMAQRLGIGFVRAGPPAGGPLGSYPAQPSYGQQVAEYGRKVLGSKFVDVGFVSRDNLAYLYSNAIASWFASKLEGFGLPALEAAACGTPAILADTPVANEVHRETGIYGYVRELKDLSRDTTEVIRNAQRFTWEKSMKKHHEGWKL